MAFTNRIRLPLYLSKPQFPDARNVFRRADGTIKVLSINISKVYTGETDYLPEWVHEALKIALSHDNVNIESNNIMIGAAAEGDYEIEWQDFLDFPYGQAKFKVAVTPYNFSNANCQSCEEASQLNLVDDTIEDPLEESTEYQVQVLTNDTINCSPITAQIIYSNSVYIASASINAATGIITFTTKNLFFQHNSVKLLTYRITCSNGSYDEADVYANANGSEGSNVLEPVDVTLDGVQDDSASFSWTAPTTPPGDGYEWQYVLSSNPAIVIESGATAGTSVSIPDTGDSLNGNTTYIFSVRSVDGADVSNWVNYEFNTTGSEDLCGRFRVIVLFGSSSKPKDISYIACDGTINTRRIQPFKTVSVCALQDNPGDPVSIVGVDSYTYLGPC